MAPTEVAKALNMEIPLKSEHTTVFMTKVRGQWIDFDKGKNGVTFFERLNKDKSARAIYDRDRRAAEHQVDAGVKAFSYTRLEGSPKNDRLDGVWDLRLKFYRGALDYINVSYKTPGMEWKDSEDFALTVSSTLNLPIDYWIRPTFMSCPGFILHAYGNGEYSNLTLQDEQKRVQLINEAQRLFVQAEKDAVIKRREKELEERKKKASSFKP